MQYQIVNSQVITKALEYHIVDHCNLRCDHCCSYSPMLKKYFVSIEQINKDLLITQKILKPHIFKIVGGEPTLHPELEEVIRIVKDSQLTSIVSLTTNGHFFDKISDESLSNLDYITVSVYTEPKLSKDQIKHIAKRSHSHNVEVKWKVQDKFCSLNRDTIGANNETKSIYNNCWIRHTCHCIKNGTFYSCTRPQYLKKISVENTDKFNSDGLLLKNLDCSEGAEIIKRYLEQETPLKSCYLCNGGNAKLEINKQLLPTEVKQRKSRLLSLIGDL